MHIVQSGIEVRAAQPHRRLAARQNAIVNSCFIESHGIISVAGHFCAHSARGVPCFALALQFIAKYVCVFGSER